MTRIEELCFYHENGYCFFLVNSKEKCLFCPNFISMKNEAKNFSKNGNLPVTYFDIIVEEKGSGFQESLSKFLE